MKLIPLRGKYGEGEFALVDDEDYAFLSTLKWHVSDQGYVKTYYQGKHRPMHQLIAGKGYDHHNQKKFDNQKSNLRPATHGQNNVNVAPRSKTGFKCVYETPDGVVVKVYKDGRTLHIGYFDEKHHAALVADLWNLDLHGEFARTNFPVVAFGKSPEFIE